jgi:carbonic anhydrase/acetyltransferase-like protein (isoleucine patch superfamily)
MGAVILDGAELGPQCLIGAKTLVTPHTKIPAGSLVLGAPGKIIRPLTPEERGGLKSSAEKYAAYALYCLRHNINIGAPLQENRFG